MGSPQEGGASEPWMLPAPTYPVPSKATQPPLASNSAGFWQILFRQVLRTAAGWSELKNSLQTQQPTQTLGPLSEIWRVAPPQLPQAQPHSHKVDEGYSLPLGTGAQELFHPYLDVFRAPGM